MSDRRAELAQIHIAKKQLGMEEEAYRAMLWTLGRVHSSADLADHGRKAVLAHLRRCGFRPQPPKKARDTAARTGWDWVNRAAPDRQAMLRKIAVMLREAGRDKPYADGIAKHMFHVERIEFCPPDQLHAVVTALVRDQARRKSKEARP